MSRIVVVGGGIAGLACAWRLREGGHDIVVLEREPVAGGRMRSEHVDGVVIDRGAQFIASAYTELHRVARAVGLADDVCTLQRARDAVLRDGRLHEIAHGDATALLRTPLLSWRAKLRLARFALELWRRRRLLDPRRPERAAPIDDADMPTLLRRLVGDEAFEYAFAPSFSSTFDSDPEDLSGAFVLLASRLLLSGFELQSFRGGTGRLTAELAARVETRTDTTVDSIREEGNGVSIAVRGPHGSDHIDADGVVVAVPGSGVAGLCPTLTAAEHEFFAGVRYVRGIIVFLVFDAPPATIPYYGVAFPRREGLALYGLAADHHKPGVAPGGEGIVNVALTATAAAQHWEEDDDRIVDLVLDELARTPIGRLSPRAAFVHRWDPMLPQFYRGYTRHLAAFHERSSRSGRLEFAGDYLVGPFTEAALTSGLRAADGMSIRLAG